jgi:RNA polymerase sigma factor (TIGR02999 family)
MADISRILQDLEDGDPTASEKLLPLVYEELRRLAAAKLASEPAGQTLDGTALVHEAYLRLAQASEPVRWNGRGHFFGAAAEAMRRILVENARRKQRLKHGGDRRRQSLHDLDAIAPEKSRELLELDEALDRLAMQDHQAAELVKLRFFAGLSLREVAEVMDVSPRKADMIWAFARAWLRHNLESGDR